MTSKAGRVLQSFNGLESSKTGTKRRTININNKTKSTLDCDNSDVHDTGVISKKSSKRSRSSNSDEAAFKGKRRKRQTAESSENDIVYSLIPQQRAAKAQSCTKSRKGLKNGHDSDKTSKKAHSTSNPLTGSSKFNSKNENSKWTIPENKKKARKSKNPKNQMKIREKNRVKCFDIFSRISVEYSKFLENKILISQISDDISKDEVTRKKTEKRRKRQANIQSLYYFTGELRSYQVEGVDWLTMLYENAINGILADDMGLGKTIQVIALFCYLYEQFVDGPYLIIAPLSTLGNWQTEFKKFAPKLPVVVFHGDAEEREKIKELIDTNTFNIDKRVVEPIIICNYETVLQEHTFLDCFIWQYLIVDEGHKLKNSETKLSLELRCLKSLNRLLLTGTPLQNNIKELWSLFNFLLPELFKDIHSFSSLLQIEDLKDIRKLLARESKTKVISTIHKVLAPFMLRREKQLVLNELVPKKEVIIHCPLTEWQEFLYRAILAQDHKTLTMALPDEDIDLTTRKRSCRNVGTKLIINPKDPCCSYKRLPSTSAEPKKSSSKLVYNHDHIPIKLPACGFKCNTSFQQLLAMIRKVVNHPYLIWTPVDPNSEKENQIFVSEDLIQSSGKLTALDALLPKLKADNHKVLIFSTMTSTLDLVEEMLLLRGYAYRRLDGGVRLQERTQGIEEFMTDPDVFVFLLSTRAGGLGLNLTAADTVIFMDRDWNPMVDLQAQDRCHRIGQTKPIMVYSLIVQGTIDEVILNCGDMKRRLERVVIQEGKFTSSKKNLDADDLRELQDLLNDEKNSKKARAKGLVYTIKEIDKVLDRRELYAEMEKRKQDNKDKNPK